MDLIYRLRALGMAGAVLHVGAHPDDEETALIAYLSRGSGVRTVYWSATRGEGGENRQGPERGEALGILRTWESLDARSVDGGEVLYGPFYDFGFVKTGEAALARWGREEVLRELVRAIRLVQPQVVISRWSGSLHDGHGHHQAIGLVMGDAFDAAGDPGRYPELRGQGLAPWQPQKLYHSTAGDWQPGEDPGFGRAPLEGDDGLVMVNTGAFDPIAGRTFYEQACIAANRHLTQALGMVPEPDDLYFCYALDRSLVPVEGPEKTFFDGLDSTLTGLAVWPGGRSPGLQSILAEARDQSEAAVEAFRPTDPVPAGRLVLRGLAAVREAQRVVAKEDLEDARDALVAYLGRKARDFEEVAARCLGMALECLVSPARVVPGQDIRVRTRLWNHGPEPVLGARVRLEMPEGWPARLVAGSDRADEPDGGRRVLDAEFEVSIPEDADLSHPYWLRERAGPHRYVWPESGPLGMPFDGPLVSATGSIALAEGEITLRAAGVHREGFLGGFREVPLVVLPPIALQPRDPVQLLPFTDDRRLLELDLAVRSIHEEVGGTLALEVPGGWDVLPAEADLEFAGGGQSRSVHFQVTVPSQAAPGRYELRYAVLEGHRREGLVVRPVRRAAMGVRRPADEGTALTEAFIILPADVSVHVLDVEFVRKLRYAYVPGREEDILRSLSRFGLDVEVLSQDRLPYADLAGFDAVVVGPNAYVLREDVRAAAARLLGYVEEGGTLIVQHQGYRYEAEGLAPYPFTYHHPHDRVTSPDGPVTVLAPDHPLLHLPNEIRTTDFEGWVHDRGLYFFGEWDPRYIPVLASHDPGEDPKAGGLLLAPYGRGSYVYAAYSFFRQIPAAVPGAVRLFANLLGLAEARIIERMQLAKRVGLLSFMTDEQLHDVVQLMSERWFEGGSYLARQGERGAELFLILEGEVEVEREGERGWTSFFREGEVLGELAILTDLPRAASLRARGTVKALSMRGDHFRRLLRQHPDLSEGMMRVVATRAVERETGGTRSGSD